MKRNFLTIISIAFYTVIFSQTSTTNNGYGILYNNYGGLFTSPANVGSSATPPNAHGVLKLTHNAYPWNYTGIIEGNLPPGDFFSTENLLLDWTPGREDSLKLNQMIFSDGETGSKQFSLASYGDQWQNLNLSGNNQTNRQGDIGFHNLGNNLSSPTFFFDAFDVGINTYEPKSALHIKAKGHGLRIEADNSTGIEPVDLTFEHGGNDSWIIRSMGSSSSLPTEVRDMLQFYAPNSSNPKIAFLSNSTATLKVGIGTVNMPGDYSLYVAKGIITEEVKVELQSSWPDFVFTEEYSLPSLEEVDAFISENKHLPNVPSQAEVEEHGINLGEMDATLLRKIEELTLYVIQLEKKLKDQQAKIDEITKP